MDVDALCKGGLTEIAMSKGMPITEHDIGAVRSAAQILRSQAAEITRLRAALDAMTAERDAAYAKGLEDAARVADAHLLIDWLDPKSAECQAAKRMQWAISKAIRAMKENK